MTREEAIKAIECNRPTCGYTILCEALDMALAALRAQQEEVNQYQCTNCGTGWGLANENGVTSCMETCEKLAAYMAQQEAKDYKTLETTWETPEFCPHCLEHLSRDWSFCPECGRPTDWSENEPLTLEELREMDGEPVWCVSMIEGKSEWAILRIVEMPKTWFIAIAGASAGYGDKDTYGKTWLAYRHKPKEDAK